jgi:hypothetical protein
VSALAARTSEERKAHALTALSTRYVEVWVASASLDGVPHLVPLSLAWDGRVVIISVDRRSATARNIASSGRARLALGQTGDVVMIDAVLEANFSLREAPEKLMETFAGQADWDPRDALGLPGSRDGGYVYLCLLPNRVQVWRSEAEHAGRTIMRDGEWLT